MPACDQQLFRRETRDDFVSGFGDDNFFFDARRAPAVGGGPEGFQRKHHSGLDLARMIEGDQAADDGFFPDRQTNAVAVLQSEGGFFIGEAKVGGLGPDRGNLGGGAAGTNQFDGCVQIVAATLIGVHHRVGRIADRETAVIAGAVSHVGMQNVVVDRISGAEDAVGENVRMRIAAFAGYGIHRLDIFRSHVVENFADQADGFVFAHTGLHRAVEFVVGCVHHHRGVVEQGDFVFGFDEAGF